jgi:hypothetical protein
VRQFADEPVGFAGKPGQRQRLLDAPVQFRRVGAAEPRAQPVAGSDLGGDADVLEHGELGKDFRDLEGARHAHSDPLVGGEAGHVAALEHDRARRRREEPADQIEEGGLAGAVRSDHRAQLALGNGHRYVAHGDQAAEALGQALDLERAHAVLRSTSPRMPRGKNSTINTISMPMNDIQLTVTLEM